MNKSLTLLTGILCYFSSFGQYAIIPLSPPPNFTFNDLWHLTVTKGGTDDYKQFYISLRLYEANMLKVKSNTAVISLPVGNHYYNMSNISDLQPFVTSYYDAGILQQAISSGGTFPPGTYNIIYTLYGKAADGEFVPLSENVTEALVEAMWPPMLLSPPDGDSIDTQYPLLTWTPAFSSAYVGQITYELKLVELFPGQNSYQAIQSNPSYFTQNNIPVTMLPYPPAAQLLDTNKVYAWQVHAEAQGNTMGSSEVWTFTWKNRGPEKVVHKIKSYFKLSGKTATEFVYVSTPFLPIVTEERYNPTLSSSIRFKILDEKMEIVGDEKKFDAAIKTGFNKYLIPVCSSEGNLSLSPGKYFLEMELEKNKKDYLPFQIQRGNCHE
jgi:hypothetical protein